MERERGVRKVCFFSFPADTTFVAKKKQFSHVVLQGVLDGLGGLVDSIAGLVAEGGADRLLDGGLGLVDGGSDFVQGGVHFLFFCFFGARSKGGRWNEGRKEAKIGVVMPLFFLTEGKNACLLRSSRYRQ